MLNRILRDVACELILRLRSDGTLELMGVETYEHRDARMEAFVVVHAYSKRLRQQPTPQDLNAWTKEPATFAGDRYVLDVVLAIGTVPIVIVEIEVKYRSVPALIAVANNYLQDRRIQRVVVFDARTDGVPANHLVKAALAVVFERALGARILCGRCPIRVVQEISVGNAPLHQSVLTNWGELPSTTDPTVPRVVTIPRSPNEGLVIQRNQVHQSFVAAVPHDLNVSVDNQPQMTFSLHDMFCASANGWSRS